MENLIMLLDDYEERIVGVHSVWDRINDKETAWIISKKFWFIAQLIKRDEINLNDSDLLTLSSELWCAVNSDIVIMVLSIQDNPIEYLCSILKE